MKTLLLTTSLVFCTSVAAFAQTADSETAAASPDQATIPSHMAGTMSIGANTLIGQKIYIGREGAAQMDEAALSDGMTEASGDWNAAGEVGNVLVSGTGEITSVIVENGGFLGIGERSILIPISELQFVRDSDTDGEYFVVYNSDTASFENAPEYDQSIADTEGLLPYGQGGMSDIAAAKALESATGGAAGSGETPEGDGTESAMATNVGEDTDANTSTDTAVATEPTEEAAVTADDAADADIAAAPTELPDATARPDRNAMTGLDAATLTAEDLTGARVYGSADNWIGEVGELVLDDDGKISQIVIDVGGWLGVGERPVALGFDQLDLRQDGDDVVVYVDSTEQELEALPEWEG